MTASKSRNRNRRQPKATTRKAFWARPANPELDRSGDWLLKNLTTTRAKAGVPCRPCLIAESCLKEIG